MTSSSSALTDGNGTHTPIIQINQLKRDIETKKFVNKEKI